MIDRSCGVVSAVRRAGKNLEELLVRVGDEQVSAVSYPSLTGPVGPGDLVLLNSTARRLGLGTGGVDFVCHNFSRPLPAFAPGGHIIKLRYTPWQVKVLSCEEKDAGHRDTLARCRTLRGMPVLIGELHSMIAPAAAVAKQGRPDCRIAYIMTDGAALPAAFSRTAAALKEKGVICATITCGHAFGGDYEAVNVYSALAACRSIVKADLAIISMGPGNVGTGTAYGFSGMELGENVNRVNAMGGIPVVIPRLSFADARRRHRGVSHHTLTALQMAACTPAWLVLPAMARRSLILVLRQLRARGLLRRHRVLVAAAPAPVPAMRAFGLGPCESMGRGYDADPVFFDAAAAAARVALRLLPAKKGCEALGGSGGGNSHIELSLPGENR
jgi:hypothetical protein